MGNRSICFKPSFFMRLPSDKKVCFVKIKRIMAGAERNTQLPSLGTTKTEFFLGYFIVPIIFSGKKYKLKPKNF